MDKLAFQLCLGFLCIGCAPATYAQSAINFSNSGGTPEQKLYIDEWLNPAALVPAGDQFMVALYYAPAGTTDEALFIKLGGPGTFSGNPGEPSGRFIGGNRTIATASPGEYLSFQVKGWESAYGSSYEEVVNSANPAARYGKSGIFSMYAGPEEYPPYPTLVHVGSTFRGFVIAVPEPSFCAFGAIVLSGFLITRKARRR